MKIIKKRLIFCLSALIVFGGFSTAFAKEVAENTKGDNVFRINIAKHISGTALGKVVEEKYFQDGVPVRWLFQDRTDGIKVVWDNQNKIAKVCRDGKELLFSCSNQELQLKENQILMPQKYVIVEDGQICFNPLWLEAVFDIYTDKEDVNDDFSNYEILQEQLNELDIYSNKDLKELKSQLSFLNIYGSEIIHPNPKIIQTYIVFSFY